MVASTSARDAVVNDPPVVGLTRDAVTAVTAVAIPYRAPEPEPMANACASNLSLPVCTIFGNSVAVRVLNDLV